MGLFDWFRGVLASLGLWQKKANIVFVGLDNAGKSTLLAKLKNSTTQYIAPTYQPTSYMLQIGSIYFRTFDLGGHKIAYKIWSQYIPYAQGIVYLVDIADPKRFSESREALSDILNNKDFSSKPIMILANKIDKDTAVSADELINALGIANLITGKDSKALTGYRPLEVFPCCVINKEGYNEGFYWLSKYI